MAFKQGDPVQHLKLPSIAGEMFHSQSLQGKPFLLSFYRFASCPFCNLRLHQLSAKFAELHPDFNIIAIFDSPLANLQHHSLFSPMKATAAISNTISNTHSLAC